MLLKRLAFASTFSAESIPSSWETGVLTNSTPCLEQIGREIPLCVSLIDDECCHLGFSFPIRGSVAGIYPMKASLIRRLQRHTLPINSRFDPGTENIRMKGGKQRSYTLSQVF
jgi:hypothetical protein